MELDFVFDLLCKDVGQDELVNLFLWAQIIKPICRGKESEYKRRQILRTIAKRLSWTQLLGEGLVKEQDAILIFRLKSEGRDFNDW